MRRRQVPQAASLTSLIDVLFILVFASLVQTALSREASDVEAARAAEADASVPLVEVDGGAASVVDAGPAAPVAHALLRDRALSDLAAMMAGRPAVVARISKDGMLTSLELPDRVVDLQVPLLERVPDLDVVVAYLGDRTAELQICRIAALRLGVDDLSQHLVVIAPDVPLSELTVALVEGLRRDADRCLSEQRGAAVVVDAAAIAPTGQPAAPTGRTAAPTPAPHATPTPEEQP